MTRYAEDEFDRAAHARGPKGVHRPTEPTWKKYLPFLVVLVVGPLLAWALISALNTNPDSGGTAATTPVATGDATAAVTDAPTQATAEPTAEATSADPLAGVQVDAPVVVLNGAGVAGIAGRTAERLTTAGFTSVEASDYGSSQPTTSTIYYNNADLAATAQYIGEQLGITQQVELASATDSIAIVLRSDFQE